MLVRVCYSKQEIHDFFDYILNGDTAFSESVRLRWRDHPNVIQLADSMNMTTKQFSRKFHAVFGTSPYKWIMEAKAELIREAIAAGKPFKLIADQFHFNSVQEFNRFVKNQCGKTPGQIRNLNKSPF